MPAKLKIAVFGTGGVGGLFGSRLARAGADVTFIARGEQLKAIQRNGLRIINDAGPLHVTSIRAIEDPREVGEVDVILLCVKAYDLVSVCSLLKPSLRSDSIVVPLQNGVDASRIVGEILGSKHVVPGCVFVSAFIESPGVIRQVGSQNVINFGQPSDSRAKAIVKDLQELCLAAGLESEIYKNVDAMLWTKFIRIASIGGITALKRLPIGEVLKDKQHTHELQKAIHEAFLVARSLNIQVEEDLPAKVIDAARKLPFEWKSSMLVDLERGRRLEIESLSGAIVRFGEQTDVSTPIHRSIYGALRPYANVGAV